MFAAGVSGGLWKTTDITATTPSWTEVDPTMDNIMISCITADPTNSQIFYLGTGEFAGTAGFGNGVYKSTDGGASWSLLSYSFPVIVSDLVVRNENVMEFYMSVEAIILTANLHNNGVVVLEVVKLGEFIVRQTKVITFQEFHQHFLPFCSSQYK